MAEFSGFAQGEEIPDPQSEDSFARSVLSWRLEEEPGATLLRFYRHLIALRKTRPALQGRTRDSMIVYPANGQVLPLERHILNDQLFIWMHFGDQPVRIANNTGQVLGKIFDSSAVEWGGAGVVSAARMVSGRGRSRGRGWSRVRPLVREYALTNGSI